MSNNIHMYDKGTIFKVKIIDDSTEEAIDISSSTGRKIKFLKPYGDSLEVVARLSTDGRDGYIEYTTDGTELDIKGDWEIQGWVEGIAYTNSSEIKEFEVHKNI